MKKARLAGAAILALILVPPALRLSWSGDAKEVETEKVVSRAITPTVLASGVLAYQSQVTLVPEVVGRVKDVLVKEGDHVVKGQLLLRLDPEAARADVAQIQASMRQADLNIRRQVLNRDSQVAKWKRYKQLREQGMIEAVKYDDFVLQTQLADVDLRTSREALMQSEAQLKQAQERLSKTEIRSPITGEVTSIYIKVGETAVPSVTSIAGSNLMAISDTRGLYAEVNVDETDIAKIRVGESARIVPAAFPEKSLAGTVETVAVAPRQIQGQNKQYAVRVRVELAPGVVFHPGMSCRAEISTRGRDATRTLAVPVQAVVYEDAEKKSGRPEAAVFVLDSGRAVKRDVTTGIADDAYIEIAGGLGDHDQVIVGPARTLRFLHDGDPVRTREVRTAFRETPSDSGALSAPRP